MDRMIFGASSADHDDLLVHCEIEDQIARYRDPIIVGRWGTGKTAILIARSRELEAALASIDPLSRREWYIREQDLEADALFQLQSSFSESPDYFSACLQKIWKSEINRRVVRILSILRKKYTRDAFTRKAHWQHVSGVALKDEAEESFWVAMTSVIEVIFPRDGVGKAIGSFAEFFSEISSSKLFRSIQQCIIDLEEHGKVVPIVGIEPLETPNSYIESRVSLAEAVVGALLNCFRNDFIRSDFQKIRVFISIPWNRIKNRLINHPQHVEVYTKEINWTKSNLREFICRRIDWEIRQNTSHRIQYRPNFDAWDVIFPRKIPNRSISNEYEKFEDSFSYICRHTLWRARDLQTIARECVLEHCIERNISVGDFFRKPSQMDSDVIRRTVSRISRKHAETRIEEARRRIDFGVDLRSVLYGAKIPMELEALRSRICDGGGYSSFASRVDALWESGILGLIFEIASPEVIRSFESRFGQENETWRRVKYRDFTAVGFLFQYNTSQLPISLYETYSRSDSGCRVYFTLHPAFNEHFDLHVNGDYPIGC